jgi:hypothetical protein
VATSAEQTRAARADAAIRRVLEPGEAVRWSGRPLPIGGANPLVWPAALFLAAFGAWPIYRAIRDGFHPVHALFAAGGALGLVVLFAGPRLAAGAVYAVTDRRVLILHRGLWTRVEAYALHGMAPANVRVTGRGAGVGTVSFADFAQRCGYDRDEICMPEFRAIPDADRVAALIRAAAAEVAAARIAGSRY